MPQPRVWSEIRHRWARFSFTLDAPKEAKKGLKFESAKNTNKALKIAPNTNSNQTK